ncbi:hypothetical protein F5Y18DRAFT_193756 [Xylariaceae sp. FL1019]|nr:hypothetical protein F5Y18DRAFT_193756 [Xylariaceae sp. FL1019]
MMIRSGTFEFIESPISRPGSPPGMSSSRSSKASSLHSFNSDIGDDATAGIGHFEDIGLEDDSITSDTSQYPASHNKSRPNPYSPSFATDLRAVSTKHIGSRIHSQPRDLALPRLQRQSSSPLAPRFRDTNTQNLTLDIKRQRPPVHRTLSARSASSVTVNRRYRSPSPNTLPRSLSPQDPNASFPPRRSSWQSGREARSTSDIEKECDEDDDDHIPDDIFLDNVPLSPRPPSERSTSRPPSASTSPERKPKDRVRSVGNGTPPVAADRGSLKSPTWKSDNGGDIAPKSGAPPPTKGRAKSWTAAISGLSTEAMALTEKLEEHADELEKRGEQLKRAPVKPRVKSALAELPPIRRSNIIIDPLPVSKEKEAVLSRTRPSWLPPKNPAEEKKHIKEYQKMMANSIEADRKREAARREKEQSRANLSRVWEEDILNRWDAAIQEQRTRELWWGGVAPRSRGEVWIRAIGNNLGLTEKSYQAALSRACEVEESAKNGKLTPEDERRLTWFSKIQTDVEQRTWLDLKLFQAGAPLHQHVVDVLRAYAMYRSDIGYISGCDAIAALLLLNIDTPASAFIALANVLNRPLPLSFYSDDPGAQSQVLERVHKRLSRRSPRLHEHLEKPSVGSNFDLRLNDILTTMFTRHLNLDDCTRLWDIYVFEGDKILLVAAVALLLEKEMALLSAESEAEVKDIVEAAPQPALQDTDGVFISRVKEVAGPGAPTR